MSGDVTPDVLVVGAGSSGAVVAARLSEDPGCSVLLVDEGPDFADGAYPDRVLDAGRIPTVGADASWTRWTDTGLTGARRGSLVRGRMVGGSSAVNGAYFVRGTRRDFDRWAGLGNAGWSYDEVLESFRLSERDVDLGDSAWHGSEGPVLVGRPALHALDPVSRAFLGSAAELGYPEEADMNSPGPPGAGVLPSNSVEGLRVNVAMAYLDPHRDRPNLTVRGGVRVRRVVVEGGRAIGVEVDAGRASRVLRAHRVVLSAGAVASAQLLMLSGIGPAEDLLANGVEVVVDAPGVGRLWNHPAVDLRWRPVAIDRGRTGRGSEGPVFGVGLHLDSGADPGRDDGDIEILAATHPYGTATGEHPEDPHLSLWVGLMRSEEPGRVTLASANPHTPPDVEHAYLARSGDRARARHAVRVAVELLERGPLAELVQLHFGPPGDVRSDAALDEWIAGHLTTAMHPSGTCAMGPEGDPDAVVDQRGQVRGVEGLVVADTSIMPEITSRGTAATAVMIGERIAELFDRA